MNIMQAPKPNELRGLVLSRYTNISKFAEAIGWDRKKASRIVNGAQKPNANEMEQMAKLLEIKDVYSFVHIFLPSLSTKWQQFEVPDPFGKKTHPTR